MDNGILKRVDLSKNTTIIIGHIPTVAGTFDSDQFDKYQIGHSTERALQLAAADSLVDGHFKSRTVIERNAQGKPRFSNRAEHISISHTGEYMAIIIGDNPVAIDIEITGRSITRIFDRFTQDIEFERINSVLKSDALLCLWSIKECLFKVVPHQGILFKEHLMLNSCKWSDDLLKSRCSVKHPQLQSEFVVNSFIFESLVISYIIENEL